MNATENLLTHQLQQSKENEKEYKQVIINMARASLKQIPREFLIEVLVKKKIIQKDWMEKRNKYKLRDDGNNQLL